MPEPPPALLDRGREKTPSAPVPPGFDVVVMQEDCEAVDHRVHIHVLPEPGSNVRLSGDRLPYLPVAGAMRL